jgi:hypothetical protein
MIRFLLLSTILLTGFLTANSQIVVDDRTLPEVGDTLALLSDNLPTGIVVGSPGADRFWDFSSLQAPFVQNSIYKDAQEGQAFDRFPSADLLIGEEGLLEAYYRVDDGRLRELGFFGSDPFGFGLSAVGKYSTPYIIKDTPMMYGDRTEQQTSLLFPIAGDQLPDTLLDLLPLTPDSIRLRVELESEFDVDAWGLAVVGNQDFDVLRQKRTEYRTLRIDALVPGFPTWTDITLIIENLLPGLVSNDTTYSYHFYDNENIQPIVVLTVDEDDEILRADFIPTEMMTPVQEFVDNGRSKLFVYPNPTLGPIRFDFLHFPRGKYTIRIMSILGVTVWEKNVMIDGDKTVAADIRTLRRGTYLYSLSDENNKRLFTKRLVVMKP